MVTELPSIEGDLQWIFGGVGGREAMHFWCFAPTDKTQLLSGVRKEPFGWGNCSPAPYLAISWSIFKQHLPWGGGGKMQDNTMRHVAFLCLFSLRPRLRMQRGLLPSLHHYGGSSQFKVEKLRQWKGKRCWRREEARVAGGSSPKQPGSMNSPELFSCFYIERQWVLRYT